MRLSKEEFCTKYRLTDGQFYGRKLLEDDFEYYYIDYLPEDCSFTTDEDLYLTHLKELPEFCVLKAKCLDLRTLKTLPENYYIDAEKVWCNIIIPTYKGSSEFFFGVYNFIDSFKNFQHIQEEPLKYLGNTIDLNRALAEYFLKNLQVNL